MSWYESRIDRLIREARERGDFDDLPGTGKPLPGRGVQDDEDWWLKQLIERENLTGLVPASLKIRKEVEDLPQTVASMTSEAAVREYVSDLNDRIELARRGLVDGPSVVVNPVNPDDIVAAWRRRA